MKFYHLPKLAHWTYCEIWIRALADPVVACLLSNRVDPDFLSAGGLWGRLVGNVGRKSTVRCDVFVSFDDIPILFYHLIYGKLNSSHMLGWKRPGMKMWRFYRAIFILLMLQLGWLPVTVEVIRNIYMKNAVIYSFLVTNVTDEHDIRQAMDRDV